METWSYGINSIYKKVSIYLEEAPWWIFALDRSIEFLCDVMPSIPLPKIKIRLKNGEDIEFNADSEWTTWREWYGDLNQLFHCLVHVPIFDFCQKRIRYKFIEIDYDKAKEIFYEQDKEFWDREREISEK